MVEGKEVLVCEVMTNREMSRRYPELRNQLFSWLVSLAHEGTQKEIRRHDQVGT